jgi:hypothetical protein
MSRYFPLTWAEWKGGIEIVYCIRETLEDRLAAGGSLSKKEKTWLDIARNVTARYDRSGHKKEGAAAPLEPSLDI